MMPKPGLARFDDGLVELDDVLLAEVVGGQDDIVELALDRRPDDVVLLGMGGDAGEPDLPGLLQRFEGLHHGLIQDGVAGREAVEVESVDIIQPETGEAEVDLLEEGVCRLARDLGGDEVGIPRPVLDDPADGFLVPSAHVAVGGVEMDEAAVEGRPDEVLVVRVHDAHRDDRAA